MTGLLLLVTNTKDQLKRAHRFNKLNQRCQSKTVSSQLLVNGLMERPIWWETPLILGLRTWVLGLVGAPLLFALLTKLEVRKLVVRGFTFLLVRLPHPLGTLTFSFHPRLLAATTTPHAPIPPQGIWTPPSCRKNPNCGNPQQSTKPPQISSLACWTSCPVHRQLICLLITFREKRHGLLHLKRGGCLPKLSSASSHLLPMEFSLPLRRLWRKQGKSVTSAHHSHASRERRGRWLLHRVDLLIQLEVRAKPHDEELAHPSLAGGGLSKWEGPL